MGTVSIVAELVFAATLLASSMGIAEGQSQLSLFGHSSGWKYQNGSCYRLLVAPDSSGMNFTDAEAQCATSGAKLASIHSEEENEFLFQLAYSRCTNLVVDGISQGLPFAAVGVWIGLLREPLDEMKTKWACKWTDQAKVVHGRELCENPLAGGQAQQRRPWGDTQPDNRFPPHEGCVFMVGIGEPYNIEAEWGDQPCHIRLAGALCKKACANIAEVCPAAQS